MSQVSITDSDFMSAYSGSFVSLMKWEDLDACWQGLSSRADDNWYVYVPGEQLPESPVSADKFCDFLSEIKELLRRSHEEDYCGIVYLDDRECPSLIKIYDPDNLGVVCGFSESPPLPGWIMSRLPPVDLKQTQQMTGSRKRWWQRIFD